MSKFLISFPASAMTVPAAEMAAVSQASREVIRAVRWAARLATACRCEQELREFYEDPES